MTRAFWTAVSMTLKKILSFELNGDKVYVAVLDTNNDLQKRTAMLVEEAFSLKNTGMRSNTGDVRLKCCSRR